MSSLSKKSYGMLALILLSVGSISADCPRCNGIESARAADQAEHPQKSGYYDDLYPVTKKIENASQHN